MTKICKSCDIPKALEEFYKVAKGKHGVDSRCKKCRLLYSKNKRIPKGNKPGPKKGVPLGPKLSKDDFINKSNKIHNNKYDYSLVEYTYSTDKVEIICPLHGNFNQVAITHKSGKGCPLCGNLIVANRKTQEEFLMEASQAHCGLYDYSKVKYINDKTKVIIICKIHGDFLQQPGSHIRQTQGCPKCNSSNGELLISSLLSKINVLNIREKRFDGCRYKRSLPFDFYLPEYNLVIEYDGVQHFRPINFNGTFKTKESLLENFELTKLKDKIKNDFCKLEGIKMIRISYKDKDKLNEKILKELLWL